eukprot:TRINITY_DN5881_c5_g1_i2.p1 TRINITY_DN5881_c5_g1~~TRINITY_DN5881_c5_g1_i2.p1  ORF type:complete len:111 (-),score=4.61 TRINITY_DN5881_c5_g1_i2:1591-1923(-)
MSQFDAYKTSGSSTARALLHKRTQCILQKKMLFKLLTTTSGAKTPDGLLTVLSQSPTCLQPLGLCMNLFIATVAFNPYSCTLSFLMSQAITPVFLQSSSSKTNLFLSDDS